MRKFMVGATGSVVFKNDEQIYRVPTAVTESLILLPSVGGGGECPKTIYKYRNSRYLQSSIS